MDLDPDPAVERFRQEVRAWLSEHVPDPPLPSVNTEAGFAAHREWERELAGARLAVVGWPEKFGGRDASLGQWLAFEEEYYRQRDPAFRDRRTAARDAPMRFALTGEQREFGATLHELLSQADVPAAARAWAEADHGPGLAIWDALAKAGVTALCVPEDCGGLGASPVDLVVACEELGHHPVPGPLAESLAAVPALLSGLGTGPGRQWLAALAAGEAIATLAAPPQVPYALDADMARLVLLSDGLKVWKARPISRRGSMDPSRRIYEVEPDQELAAGPDRTEGIRYGTLASAGLLLGAGRGLLDAAVHHARTREQFGRPVGAFQAVKHALADVLIAIEFARPLLYAAAVAIGTGSPSAARDVSAARVACGDAARLAARTALQVHGAIGYTRECDVSLWLAKVRALSSAWGSQAGHRAVVLAALTEPETGPWN